MEKEQENNIQKSLDTIAQTTAYILENMVTKEEAKAFLTKEDGKAFLTKEDGKAFVTKNDLAKVELNLQTQINGIESDLKSFKQETKENFEEVNEKLEDILDTNTNFDKRIEKLEEKVFA